ncbi:ERV-BabFcenv provirus ancestral Env polyprotein [Microcebus murinus]|uniref:endogenous retrovirus group FC1 Env polyprotein n=1 Tax=Microcebus murinus TaxID=30608 RepID=UPI000643B65F|nr:endogenous retrovirus group FC1 Env polyprotein [Microcebus murinus]XP_012607733.1 endogenous retrovirus group FC1 Env polyprotein [Microcebus murinus]XP_020145497.1 endogenous retrovirus group FC1 Env polyprotein [Microcebus murinus]
MTLQVPGITSRASRGPHLKMLSRPTPATRWVLLNSVLHGLLYLLTLPTAAPDSIYVWRFKVRESLPSGDTRLAGSADCSPKGCQASLTIPLSLTSVTGAQTAALCFLYDQTFDYCRQQPEIYGGCRKRLCKFHEVQKGKGWRGDNEKTFGWRPNAFYLDKGKFQLDIPDPWDQRWEVGVTGKLYWTKLSSYPSATIHISREYVLAHERQIQISTNILQAEQTLAGRLPPRPQPSPLSSWLDIIQHTLAFLKSSEMIPNISHCFLCASLQQPLLAAVPLNYSNPPTTPSSPPSCSTPLTRIPLWEPEPTGQPYADRVCFLTSRTDPNLQLHGRCLTNHTVTTTTSSAPGQFFWCNGTLTRCVNTSTPGPCFPVMVVPQLTLYGESEFGWLLPGPRPRRAIFLPVMVGLTLASSLASGFEGGTLGYGVISAQDFADHLQIALETTSASLASLQRQLTSLAQVTLQNRRALDLLTAEKEGTCLFLREECCYYVNESGLVEQNIDKLTNLSEDLHNRHRQDISPLSWIQSPLATWLLPLIGPIVIICLIFLFVPCLLQFLQRRLRELSRMAVNQTLYSYFPLPVIPAPAAV